MPKFIQRRSDAPFAIVKDVAIPHNINTGYGGVSMQVAALGEFATAVSAAAVVPATEPTAAKQILRWHMLNNQSGKNAAPVLDYSGSNNTGKVYNLGAAADWATLPYTSQDNAALGAYGVYFWGGDAFSLSLSSEAIPKLAGASVVRFVFGLLPLPWTDRAIGRIGNFSNISMQRLPDNSLDVLVTGSETRNFRGVFTNSIPLLLEVEFDDYNITVFKNGKLLERKAITIAPVINGTSKFNVGNQSSGGGAFTGNISYAAVYRDALTEGELQWIRNEAKAVMLARPSNLLVLPDMPLAKPDNHLKFSALPATVPTNIQTVGGLVTLVPGRAIDGLNGPIVTTHQVLFGPVAGAGVDITPKDLVVKSPGAGYLTYKMTADNGIHPVVTEQVILPVAQAYPPLNAAAIAARLTVHNSVYIDNADAGFPSDIVWSPSCIVDPGDGTVGFRLLANTGSGRPHMGGSAQINFNTDAGGGGSSRLFSVDYYMQLIDTRAPGLAKGYVQTGFTFTEPWTARRRELDFEYNSRTGRMECSIHLEPNEGGVGSRAEGIHIVVPEGAFTAQRKWSIVSNADRVEWFYEDQLLVRYVRGLGWDSSVQAFTPYRNDTAARFNLGDVWLHPNDAHWHLNAQKIFIQQWMSSVNTGWVGPNTVPIDHPLLRFSNVDGVDYGPIGTKLLVGDWTAVAGAAGQIIVSVGAYRPSRFRPTHLEYRVNGGAWTRFAGTTGNQIITGVAAGSRNVEIRPVAESLATNPAVVISNFTMSANASDVKAVVVT